MFSLIIGVTADKIGFNPLFIAMGFLILLVLFLVTFIAERRKNAPEGVCGDENIKNWKLQNQSAHHIELLVDGQHSLCLYILEENMFRVLLKRKGFCRWTEPGALLRKRMSRGRASSRRY